MLEQTKRHTANYQNVTSLQELRKKEWCLPITRHTDLREEFEVPQELVVHVFFS